MFEIKPFHENVFIDGYIYFDSDKEVSYTDIVSFSTMKKCDCNSSIMAEKPIEGRGKIIQCVSNECIFNDKAIFQVTGDAVSLGNEKKLPNPYNCIYSYNCNILDMDAISNSGVNDVKPVGETDISIVSIYRILNSASNANRMIYLSILSNYELFMLDILTTCYLRFPKVKEWFHSRVRFNGLSVIEVVNKLKENYYNNFSDVENLFKVYLNVNIPDYSYLQDAYKKRNDIAHRYDTSLKGEKIIVTNENLEELVRETNKFVYELFDKIINVVYDE